MARTPSTLINTIASILFLSPYLALAFGCTFTISNNCRQTIWPGTLAGAGTTQLPTTGFRLDAGQTVRIPAPSGWSGRIWARTGCKFDKAGVGECETGDCGGRMECSGRGASPPVTVFEITLGKNDGDDFYDVSVVDGYNLPVAAAPRAVTTNGSCLATGCVADLNSGCPKELQVEGSGGGAATGVVACKSACEAFGLDHYCCSGEFANPTACKPSFYSTLFKAACPRAYSYAFDDATSTFTCKVSEYSVTFCPTINGLRRSNGLPTYQPTQEHSYGETHKETTSLATTLFIPFYYLLILILLC